MIFAYELQYEATLGDYAYTLLQILDLIAFPIVKCAHKATELQLRRNSLIELKEIKINMYIAQYLYVQYILNEHLQI